MYADMFNGVLVLHRVAVPSLFLPAAAPSPEIHTTATLQPAMEPNAEVSVRQYSSTPGEGHQPASALCPTINTYRPVRTVHTLYPALNHIAPKSKAR